MVSLEILVSVHDRRSFSLSLTLIFVVTTSGHIAPERHASDPDLDGFAFIIPLDCKTSTPVTSRKQKILPDWGGERLFLVLNVKRSPDGITVPGSKRRSLIEVHNYPWPRVEQDSPEG